MYDCVHRTLAFFEHACHLVTLEFCDQAYWQSSVAAKPLQGMWGSICGDLTWFVILFILATTMDLVYLGLSSAQGSPTLTEDDIMIGLAAPLVAQKLLGTTGDYAMLLLTLMAVDWIC